MLSDKEWASLLKTSAIYSCEDEYKLFVFAYFLSFPIPTSFEQGVILIDDKFYSLTDKFINSFEEDEKCRINFQKCWDYLHDGSKFKVGLSQNNASRFISILSKLNASEDIISSIFYSTMALEAVYARGMSEGISRQIIDKVKIFLCTDIDEKKLKKIYDIRSHYIHGDSEIQLAFLDYDVDKKDELYELFSYICDLLYNTAKRIIEENLSKIDFDYTIKLS